MVNIAILSVAHMHAYSYAECLNASPDATLAGIWDPDSRRGKDAARQFRTRYSRSLDALLENRSIDAVVVCSENVYHRELVEAAARAGKWVLCEKPIATTVVDATAMIRTCRKQGVGLGIAFPCRFVTPLVDLRNTFRAGTLGALRAAFCTNNGQFPGGWFADPALSGGGAVMDHTVHVADALRWITGREFDRVYCASGALLHPGAVTDDVGSLQLEMEGGVAVSHVASWNRPPGFPTWGDVTMEFVGTKGSANVDAFRQKIDVYRGADRPAEWAFWGDSADAGLVADFAAAVRDRREPGATGVDGLRALEVSLAAERSAVRGTAVRVRRSKGM